MSIESLPKTYDIEGLGKCYLTVKYQDSGWKVTYDPLEMDYYPTLQDSVDALVKKLNIRPELLTEEWLKEHGYRPWRSRNEIMQSGDGLIELVRHKDGSWEVHIDDERYSTFIGGLEVQEVWQFEELLKLINHRT